MAYRFVSSLAVGGRQDPIPIRSIKLNIVSETDRT
jgi:hypothetical protein